MTIKPCGNGSAIYDYFSREKNQESGLPKPNPSALKGYSVDDTPKVGQKGMIEITEKQARDF
ncbi:MAG: hypothetical protein JSS30_08315 [Verrucomicrobia bacterium]|nr:hypothetical protein [Verrucomicrobiota bacterium]